MANVDKWLADAAKTTKDGGHPFDSGRVMQRLPHQRSPVLALITPDLRLTMLCTAVATAAVVITSLAGEASWSSRLQDQPSAVWISTPPAASPFGLLVGA